MKGLTYFKCCGFAINEGCFPNIHISWDAQHIFIYVALIAKLRWYKTFKFNVK